MTGFNQKHEVLWRLLITTAPELAAVFFSFHSSAYFGKCWQNRADFAP